MKSRQGGPTANVLVGAFSAVRRGGGLSVTADHRVGVRRGVAAWLAAALAMIAGLLGSGASPVLAMSGVSAGATAHRAAGVAKDRIAAAYSRSPLAFAPNRGQTASEVSYLAHGPGYGVFITPRRTVLALPPRTPPGARRGHAAVAEHGTGAALSIRAVGANAHPAVTADGPLEGKANYLAGGDRSGWRTGVSTYRQVTARQVYPGVDLRWYGTQRALEYDVVVARGADPGRVRLAIDGLRGRPRLNVRGDLVMPTVVGDVVQRAPHAYQVIDGVPHPVAARFDVSGGNGVGFTVARYDHRQPLIIDPTLEYSTYLGGTGDDSSNNIAVDSSGNAYLTGFTNSIDFPVTPGAFQTVYGGGIFDTYVTKLNPTGTAPVYSTYLGGTDDDEGSGIAVDSAGNAYLTGITDSLNFPVTPGAFQTLYGGGIFDAYVTKLNPTGTALVYSTYLGGTDDDEGFGIALDSAGNAYLTGVTSSTDFPVTAGAFQTIYGGGLKDGFVAKFGPPRAALTPALLPARRVRHRQAATSTSTSTSTSNAVANAVAKNSTDTAVTGHVDSHAHTWNLSTAPSGIRTRGHRWHHRHG